jgi:hypothetical protein
MEKEDKSKPKKVVVPPVKLHPHRPVDYVTIPLDAQDQGRHKALPYHTARDAPKHSSSAPLAFYLLAIDGGEHWCIYLSTQHAEEAVAECRN